MSEITTKKGRIRFRGKAIRDLTLEEQIELADALIDRDAETWKRYVRERSPFDFVSRASDQIILFPKQR